tara:strand:+ start:461 stop:766 length:306 start_codon:yes stop_codon:yes gene_type:complete
MSNLFLAKNMPQKFQNESSSMDFIIGRNSFRRINLNDDSEKSTKRNNAINTNSLSSGLRINKLKYHHIGLGSMKVKNENEKLSYNNNDINYMNFRLNRVRY